MTTRSRRDIITFKQPFCISGIDRVLPGGDYEIVTDEELIEGLSFASYRRSATFIMAPGKGAPRSAMEMIPVQPADLAEAQRQDAHRGDAQA